MCGQETSPRPLWGRGSRRVRRYRGSPSSTQEHTSVGSQSDTTGTRDDCSRGWGKEGLLLSWGPGVRGLK